MERARVVDEAIFDRIFPRSFEREKALCTRMREGARRRSGAGGSVGDEQSVLRLARGERIINDVLEKFRGKVLLSRAMADLLSNRADAYARFYFRVRARQGVVQRPVSVHLFFSPRHRRAAGTFFFFVGNQELIRSEPALRDCRWHTPGAYFSTPSPVIVVAGGATGARARFAVSKKKKEKKEKKKGEKRYTSVHVPGCIVGGQNPSTRRPNCCPCRVLRSLAIVRDLKTRCDRLSPPIYAARKHFCSAEGSYSISNAPSVRRPSFSSTA